MKNLCLIVVCCVFAYPALAVEFFVTPEGAGEKTGARWEDAANQTTSASSTKCLDGAS